MRVFLKLLPPYSKPGEKGEIPLELSGGDWNLRRVAEHLAAAEPGLTAFPLVDEKGFLTAEFMLNGKHASPDRSLDRDDVVTVIPYIGGG